MKKEFTQASAAIHIAGINRLTASAMAHFAGGMWNPHFCASGNTGYAESVCEDLEERVRRLRAYIEQARTRES